MQRGTRIALTLLAAMAGGFVAALTAILVSMFIGLAAQWANPADPSAGSAAEIVILLLPLSVISGFIAGGILAWRRTRRQTT